MNVLQRLIGAGRWFKVAVCVSADKLVLTVTGHHVTLSGVSSERKGLSTFTSILVRII